MSNKEFHMMKEGGEETLVGLIGARPDSRCRYGPREGRPGRARSEGELVAMRTVPQSAITRDRKCVRRAEKTTFPLELTERGSQGFGRTKRKPGIGSPRSIRSAARTLWRCDEVGG